MNKNRLEKAMRHIRPGNSAYSIDIREDGTAYISFYDDEVNDLPEPTPEELKAVVVDAVKKDKINEFAARSVDDLSPHFTGDHGRDETTHILAAHVLQICQALGIEVDPRLQAVVDMGNKARTKQEQILNAMNEDEVEMIEWDTP